MKLFVAKKIFFYDVWMYEGSAVDSMILMELYCFLYLFQVKGMCFGDYLSIDFSHSIWGDF